MDKMGGAKGRMWTCLPVMLLVGSCSHVQLPATPIGCRIVHGQQARRAAFVLQLHVLRVEAASRLRGGSDGEPEPEGGDGEGTGPWDRYALKNEPVEPSYELVRNLTAKLPSRSRRLGPLQMSWGLSDTTNTEEWRDEIRASVRADSPPPAYDDGDIGHRNADAVLPLNTEEHPPEQIFQRFLDGTNFMKPSRGQMRGSKTKRYQDDRGVFVGAKGMARACQQSRAEEKEKKKALHERLIEQEEAAMGKTQGGVVGAGGGVEGYLEKQRRDLQASSIPVGAARHAAMQECSPSSSTSYVANSDAAAAATAHAAAAASGERTVDVADGGSCAAVDDGLGVSMRATHRLSTEEEGPATAG